MKDDKKGRKESKRIKIRRIKKLVDNRTLTRIKYLFKKILLPGKIYARSL